MRMQCTSVLNSLRNMRKKRYIVITTATMTSKATTTKCCCVHWRDAWVWMCILCVCVCVCLCALMSACVWVCCVASCFQINIIKYKAKFATTAAAATVATSTTTNKTPHNNKLQSSKKPLPELPSPLRTAFYTYINHETTTTKLFTSVKCAACPIARKFSM